MPFTESSRSTLSNNEVIDVVGFLTCKYCGKKYPLSEDYAHSQHEYGHDEEIKRIRRLVGNRDYLLRDDILREFQHKAGV